MGLGGTCLLVLVGLAALMVKRPQGAGRSLAGSAGPVDRREVLEKLARKEISREEADRLLAEPPAPAGPVQPRAGRRSNGCLILVLIVGLALLVVLGLGGFLMYGQNRRKAEERRTAMEHQVREEMQRALESVDIQHAIHPGTQPTEASTQKGEPMTEEQLKKEEERIRKMEKDGTLTHDEAERLLKALAETADKKQTEEKAEGDTK
jgi:hypothetical protein